MVDLEINNTNLADGTVALMTKHKEIEILTEKAKQCASEDYKKYALNDSCIPSNIAQIYAEIDRLRVQIHRLEIDVMRRHIMDCPGLSKNSGVLDAAIHALDIASHYVNDDIGNAIITSDSIQNDSFRLDRSNGDKQESCVKPEIDGTTTSINDKNENRALEESSQNSTSSDKRNFTFAPYKIKHESNEPRTNISSNTNNQSIRSKILRTFTIMRYILLDLPLMSSFISFSLCVMSLKVYNNIYEPLMDSLVWNEESMIDKHTHYPRRCDNSDISTLTSNDFILDPNVDTPEHAFNVTMTHGVSVFPELLSQQTISNMRKYVINRNKNLGDDAIWLISQNQRWSFAIGADEDPAVPPVLKEIASNEFFFQSVGKIIGEDPALVEFTAITAAFGAQDQHWHSDNSYSEGQIGYARNFVAMYSLFIPLQDTTREMGATSVCPGTHLCGNDANLGEMCDALKFQLHDSRGEKLAKSPSEHVWKAGDGLLMHLNTYHRGPAHIDPEGKERVMLIISFASKPNGPHLDTRQISLGTSYSTKWDMWGMTMNDLKYIDRSFVSRNPWKILRTLGIFKWKFDHPSHSVKWGWDYLSVTCSRIANDQMGFRFSDLQFFVTRMTQSGFVFRYLFGNMPRKIEDSFNNHEEETDYEDDGFGYSHNNGWREYISQTLSHAILVFSRLYVALAIVYLIIDIMVNGPNLQTVLHVGKVNLVIVMVFLAMYYIITNVSTWGKDIMSGKLGHNPLPKSRRNVQSEGALVPSFMKYGPNTLFSNNDIFIPTCLNSPYLGGHNHIMNYQAGNKIWNSMVLTAYEQFNQLIEHNYPQDLTLHIASSIVKRIRRYYKGRFLRQTFNGNWSLMTLQQAIQFTSNALLTKGNNIMEKVQRQILEQVSECKHGPYRDTAMFAWHSITTLKSLENSIFPFLSVNYPSSSAFSSAPLVNDDKHWNYLVSKADINKSTNLFHPSKLSKHFLINNILKMNGQVMKRLQPENDSLESILSVGDIVEAYFENDGWFRGRVTEYYPGRSSCSILFDDGDFQPSMRLDFIRPFEPYTVGDTIYYYSDDGELLCIILDVSSRDTLSVQCSDDYLIQDLPSENAHRKF